MRIETRMRQVWKYPAQLKIFLTNTEHGKSKSIKIIQIGWNFTKDR